MTKSRPTVRWFVFIAGLAFLLLGTGIKGGAKVDSPSFDILIKNGTVVDGIKDNSFTADVGIAGDKIVAIGDLESANAKIIIDASGKIVSPGFIDIHSHTGLELLVNPKAESKIRQGVTTELGGNCGGSEFPLKADDAGFRKRVLERMNVRVDWTDLAGFLSRLSKQGTAINFATLVGQGTVREYVMAEERREPTPEELGRMKNLVAEAMEQGAFGLSSGLEYTPSGFALAEEVVELAKIAAQYGGIYATHIRSEDSQVMEALAEAIHIAESARLPLQISHYKVCGTTNWWKMPMMMDLIERAKARGVDVAADRYPYTAYSTGLSVNFPQWALAGGSEALVKRLQDPGERARMKPETMEKMRGTPWENIVLIGMRNKENQHLMGKNIGQAAAEKNQDPYEFACDLIISEGGNVSIVGFAMSEEDTELTLKHPQVMLCSDGSALAPYGPLDRGIPHPRNYGTFPRFLGLYVRERKALPLPEAIKKMSSMPAARLGLKDRGTIQSGSFADLVVFDLEKIAEKSTYSEPKQYPEGIDYVIVNGTIVIDHGTHSGQLPGKVLFGPGKKS